MKRDLHAGGSRSRGLSLNVFSESELDDIHFGTLEGLERTGVVDEILATHRPVALRAGAVERIEEIITGAGHD